ncbi:3D domain-containing protein [Paenibacillus sinensis]|uniref:3D domain-containing protein n=1 Tax=Paenibacillus TaxID=44249 RepID=UPI003898F9A6
MIKNIKTVKAAAALLGLSVMLMAAPAQAERIHVAGDQTTFYRVAQKYGVSVDKLVQANPSVDPQNIYPGLRLVVPDNSALALSEVASAASAKESDQGDKTVEAWGKVFSYEKTLQVKATAYSSALDENGPWGAVDYFGNPLKLGTIAVDPSVIPLGTKVLVTGYTHPGLPKQAFVATALDTGSAIKGNRIDIFIPGSQSFVSEFGFQNVELYLIN